MAARKGIEADPRIREIESKLIARDNSLRELADEYGYSPATLSRHRRKLPGTLAELAAKQARLKRLEENNIPLSEITKADDAIATIDGHALLEQLGVFYERIKKIGDAAHEYLQDPDDPEKYNLSPRAEEVIVTIEDESSTGRPKRVKMTLQEAIDMTGRNVIESRTQSNDPRMLLFRGIQSVQQSMGLFMQYAAELRQQGADDITKHKDFAAVMTAVFTAIEPYPEATEAVKSVLHGLSKRP